MSQSPIVVVSHSDPEIGGYIIDHGDSFTLLGKFDSAGGQYLFAYDFTNEGALFNSTLVPIHDYFTQFSLSEILIDSISEHIYYVGHAQVGWSSDWQAACITLAFDFSLIDHFIAGDPYLNEVVYASLINANGNIMLGGWQLPSSRAFLFEYGSDGELIQEKIFVEDTTWLGVIGLIEKTDGLYYYSSQSKYEVTVIEPSDLSIVSSTTHAIRDSSYLMRYLLPIHESDDFICSVVQKPSEDVLFENYYLTRMNATFDTLWSFDIGLAASNVMLFKNSLVQTGDDNFAVAYSTCIDCNNYLYEPVQHQVHVLQFSGEGDVNAETSISDSINLSYLQTMPAADGGVFVIAATYDWHAPDNYLDIAVYKIDEEGNVLTSIHTSTAVEDDVLIFPNPFEDIIHVQLNGKFNANRIDMFNAIGGLVYTSSITNGSNILTLPSLSPGAYFYVIQGADASTISGTLLRK
jgi:hypothetical protein